MAYHPALLLHAVGAGAALAGSNVAIISSAPRCCDLVGLPAVFSMPRAQCACNPPAALHISHHHMTLRVSPAVHLSLFRLCVVGCGAMEASVRLRLHRRSCSATRVALRYPGP